MKSKIVIDKKIFSGNASRFIKQGWLVDNSEVDATAFDLRDITPPETYVSFFLVEGSNIASQLLDAYKSINQRRPFKNEKGAIVILNIEICLEEVNDEEDDIICFTNEGLPHCGLNYLTSDLAKITEAKNTLCFLARENIKLISHVKSIILQQATVEQYIDCTQSDKP